MQVRGIHACRRWPARSRRLACAATAAAIACLPPSLSAQSSARAPTRAGEITELPPATAREAALGTAGAQATEVVDGLALEVWAPPGLVANPLTLDLDAQGRAFVVASARAGLLLDIRQHPDWVPEVHSLRSTEELREFFRREMAIERSAENDWLPDYNEDGSRDYRDLTVVAERVFRVEDTDGDGLADRSQVVYEGFNDDIASDIAGGILVRDETLYVTAAPDLWQLRDTTGDGLYDEQISLSHGYSVHPAFSGHDMSALAMGPDGRLYWKIGDIGLNVVDDAGRRWEFPNTGAVLRAEPDGSGFEVFAWGLRNTQEIDFDQHGNLISVDNDGDHAGETERVVYIVQGSDAGWRSTWQYGKYTDPRNNRYNVWMAESLYRPRFEGQAAYITPPIAPHHAGPSGFAFNPGTALGERWRDHFFVTSFTGGAANASVYAFRLEPDGAGFTLAGDTRVVRGLLSSGLAFGPDGALYLTDWVRGWGATGEGHLWRLDAPDAVASAARREVEALLSAGFGELGRRRLEELIAHADMRVRLESQFELVRRGEAQALGAIAADHENRLARLHAIWGLGQLGRRDVAEAEPLRALLADADAEVRAQAARTLGDVRDAGATQALIESLADAAPRVRFFAIEALGRIGDPSATAPIVSILAVNDDADVYLRTAGVHALASIGDRGALAALARHPSGAVRLAAVVALRRLKDPGAAAFIDDADPLVVTEAARAINDEGGIPAALPALAAALEGPVRDEAFVRRAISANLRVGDASSAMRLGRFAAEGGAAGGTAAEPMRVEAIAALGVWAEPSTMDRVDGAWLGQAGERDATAAREAVADLLPLLDADATPSGVKIAVLDAGAMLGVDEAPAFALRRLEADPDPEVRIAALASLRAAGAADVERATATALEDDNPAVRTVAIDGIPEMTVSAAARARMLQEIIGATDMQTPDRQRAIAALASIDGPEAIGALAALLDRLEQNSLPSVLELDLLEAASASGNADLHSRLEALGVGRELGQLTSARPAALEQGGSAGLGRALAYEHPAAQCTRCHTIGDSESTIGPDLNGVGARLTRAELLEAMLDPGAAITAGFGDADAASAMPPMGTLLTPRQLRDIVEFLATGE